MNLYEELELPRDCTAEQIKNQYRALAQKHHPDKGGDIEKFRAIKLAYEVLSDPSRRAEYDSTGNVHDFKNVQQEAVENLSKVFHNVINNIDPQENNLIETMKNETQLLKNMVIQDQETCRKYIKNLEIARDKIKLKKEDEENVIMSFVNNQLEIRNNELKTFQRRLEVSDLMLRILDNYHYGFLELMQESNSEEIPAQ